MDYRHQPNIFSFATKELSQDAFICWLIDNFNNVDSPVRSASISFLKLLYEKCGDSFIPDNVEKIIVTPQYKKIDVFLEVIYKDNKKDSIIIEDKVNSEEHSKQLEKYAKIEPDAKKIYLKTGKIYEYEIINATSKGFQVFSIDDFIYCLEDKIARSSSEILNSFHEHLIAMNCFPRELKTFFAGKQGSFNEFNEGISKKCKIEKVYFRADEFYWELMKVLMQGVDNCLLYRGTSFGWPWTQCEFVRMTPNPEFSGNNSGLKADHIESLFFRLDFNGDDSFMLSLKQYSKLPEACLDEKKQRYEEICDIYNRLCLKHLSTFPLLEPPANAKPAIIEKNLGWFKIETIDQVRAINQGILKMIPELKGELQKIYASWQEVDLSKIEDTTFCSVVKCE